MKVNRMLRETRTDDTEVLAETVANEDAAAID